MQKVHTKKELPHKPSELIILAMDDLNRAERSNKYIIEMSSWHQPRFDECRVCLAGAVMAMTLKIPINLEIDTPAQFPVGISQKLTSLDYFRLGNVGDAFDSLGRSRSIGERFNRKVPHYSYDRRGFKLVMRRLAKDLEVEGL